MLLDPRQHDVNNKSIYDWRQVLKYQLLVKRGFKSDWSGKVFTQNSGCHLHEGLVTRAMAPKSLWWHYQIFSEYNSILLLPDEHIPSPPSKEWCILKAGELYTPDVVIAWFYSLPFRVPPFRIENYYK